MALAQYRVGVSNDHQLLDRAGLTVEHRRESFTAELPVRWGDLDAQGHVNNAMFLDYLQDARVDFLLAGEVPAMLDDGAVVAEHTIEYRAPITFSGQPVQVHIAMVERRLARFRVGYLVSQGNRLCAVATSLMVPFDLASQRPRKISDEEAAWFDRFVWRVDNPFRDVPRIPLQGRGHVTPVQTRWSDVDRFGHVNNVRTLDYFQEARIAMTMAADPGMARSGTVVVTPGLVKEGTNERFQWLVARQDIDYLGQIRFRREPYQVHTGVTRLGNSSMSLAEELIDPATGDLLARARTVMVCALNDVPHPIEERSRQGLAQFSVDA